MRLPLAIVASALLVSAPASGGDTWTTPFPGVRHLYRTTSTPLRIHALVVDLCTPGVSLRATASDERARTTSSFGNLVGAEAAVNGDYFSASAGYKTSGLAMGDGAVWSDTGDNGFEGFVAFGPSVALLSPPAEVAGAAPPGAREIVSGRPMVVKGGSVPSSFDCSTHYCENNPRTGTGLSRDRRTLIVVVVDGRSTASVGVTMAGLGAILSELGAYDAIALDGGGSSTMWLSGEGVVNAPSDGVQRTVANHLGVLSKGITSGTAVSCVENAIEELVAGIHQLDEVGTSDVDGDGRADACARAAAGFRCHLSEGTAFGEVWELAELSDEAGFADAENHATIRMGDIDGDGRADVCARADDGVRCWPSTGRGFGRAIAGPAWSDEAGWQALAYATTMRLADVDGDGRDDLCARGAAGLVCVRSNGAAFEGELTLAELSDENGWDAPQRFGTLRFGDLDGDGRADVCARAAEGMRCWLSEGTGFGASIDGPDWSDDAGWNELRYWSTIRLLDVDGDGRAELCARASDGIHCHRFDGGGFGAAIAGPALADTSGWNDQQNYLTLRASDIDGDGRVDLCARANAGWRCWPSQGDGFGDVLEGPELSDAKGWYRHRYFRTIRTADIDGDGLGDLCARAAAGLRCWPSEGAAFGEAIAGPEWSDDAGWDLPQYYQTVRIAGPRPPRPEGGAGGSSSQGGASSAPLDEQAGGSSADCACRQGPRPPQGYALVIALALVGMWRRQFGVRRSARRRD